MQKVKIVEVTHITEVYGPAQALEIYLKKRKFDFFFIAHPLLKCSIRYTIFKTYENGKLKKQKKFGRKLVPNYLLDVLYSFYIVIFKINKIDIFVGVNNLNDICGILLKKMGIVKKVIYYVIDYTPKRFKNRVMNYFYHLIDRYCVKNCDYIWKKN